MKRMPIRWAAVTCVTIVFALISVIGFALIPLTPSFWIGWSFTAIAYGTCTAELIHLTSKNSTGAFLRLPASIVVISYAFIQSFTGLILAVTGTPWKNAAIISIALLAIALIALLVSSTATTFIASKDAEIAGKNTFINESLVELDQLRNAIKDNVSLENSVSALYEQLRFSDPIGCSETQGLESEIRSIISRIESLVNPLHEDQILALIADAQVKLNKRNGLCKISK